MTDDMIILDSLHATATEPTASAVAVDPNVTTGTSGGRPRLAGQFAEAEQQLRRGSDGE